MNDFKHIEDLIEVTNCRFVSFKYFSKDGYIQQFDIPSRLLKEQREYIAREFDLNIAESRAFVDPFRSFPTISVFCYKRFDNNSNLITLKKMSDSSRNHNNFQASISFWIINNELESNEFLPMQADPHDLYANFRSEISVIANDIKINILSHHYGHSYGESVINISAASILQLAEDILLAKFIISNCAVSYNLEVAFVSFNHSSNLQITCNHIKSSKWLKYDGLVHNQIDLYGSLISFISTW